MNKIQNKRISLRISDTMLKDISKVKGANKSIKIKRILEAGLNNQPIDNVDYSDILSAIFELKTELAPIGGNLNQISKYFNQGNEFENITNLDVLDKLQPQFKQMMKLLKFMQRELKIR